MFHIFLVNANDMLMMLNVMIKCLITLLQKWDVTPPAAPATSAMDSAPQGGSSAANRRSKENEDRAARHPRPEPAEEIGRASCRERVSSPV